jgi:uncharacterized protein (DUF58 family)
MYFMNKTLRLIQNYLVFSIPLIITCMGWATFLPNGHVAMDSALMVKVLWEVLSWNLMIWFVVLFVFLVALVVLPSSREKTLSRLANVKERDEREQYITGKASRVTYISTLSLLILFLFLSTVSLDITQVPKDQAPEGKNHTVSISAHFSFLEDSKPATVGDSNKKVLFESKSLSLSKPAIVLILLLWQLFSFNLSARRELKLS